MRISSGLWLAFLVPMALFADYSLQNEDEGYVITPSAAPNLENDIGFFLTGDFIYWTAREEGLDYASSGFSATGNASHRGKVYTPDFGFHPGFKVGAGKYVGDDGWDTYVNYTWLHVGTRTSQVSTSGTLFPLWVTTSTNFFGPVLDGDASWNFHFNTIDWEVGRDFFVSSKLALRPNFGLKGSWQKQHFNTHFTNVISGSFRELTQQFSQKYHGVGIRTGLDTSWQFLKHWGIYGDFALSGMWSQFHRTRKDTEEVGALDLVYINNRETFHTITPVLELGAGVSWGHGFCSNKYHVAMQAGWEEQIWWNMNQFFGVHDRGSHGNLILQGLTFDMRFDF